MNYKVKYARHHESMEEEFEKLEDALVSAWTINEYELGYVKEILDGNGTIILEGKTLLNFYGEFNEFFDSHKDTEKLIPVQHLNETSKVIMEALEKGLEEREETE